MSKHMIDSAHEMSNATSRFSNFNFSVVSMELFRFESVTWKRLFGLGFDVISMLRSCYWYWYWALNWASFPCLIGDSGHSVVTNEMPFNALLDKVLIFTAAELCA
jgi:hypothetical protein